MLRGIMVSLLLIGLAAYSLGASTLALFTDTESSSGTFRAGTLQLHYRVSQDSGLTWGNWQNGGAATFSVTNLQRGQSGTVVYQIGNLGTVGGLLGLGNVVVTDYGNPGSGQGSLASALLVTVAIAGNTLYSGPLKGFSGSYPVTSPVPAGGSVNMTINWLLPSLSNGSGEDDQSENCDGDNCNTNGDIIDGDSSAVSFNFVLVQA